VSQNCVGDVVARQQRWCHSDRMLSLLCSTTLVVIAASLPSCCHLEASFCVSVIVVSCCSVGNEGSGDGNLVGVWGLWECCSSVVVRFFLVWILFCYC
jgi:hypothetical protein